MADDLGARELGCYGNTRNRTPHLDSLARTGVQFRTAYATPLCHPTRVELLTGQYGCHSGVYNFAGMRGGPERDSPAEDIGKNQCHLRRSAEDARLRDSHVPTPDKLVGRLVKALDDSGLRENTIIFFTADNGTGGDGGLVTHEAMAAGG